MKKFLLLTLSFFGIVLAALAQGTATFDFSNPTGLKIKGSDATVTPIDKPSTGQPLNDISLVNNNVEIAFDKGEAKNPPVLFTKKDGTSYELRVYKKNAIYVKAPLGYLLKKIDMTGDAVGEKNVSASEGAFNGNTWTGEAESVDLTPINPIKCLTMTVTFGKEGETETPDTPQPGEKKTFFSETFLNGLGQFTTVDPTPGDSVFNVWNSSSTYGAKASAFVNGKAFAKDSWLVSPVFDFTKASNLSMTFEHAINKGDVSLTTQQCRLLVKVEGGEWTELPITTYPTCTDWKYVTNTQDLSAYNGKKIQIAFAYTSTKASAPTWEMRNLVIEGTGETVVPEPELPHYASLADMQQAATTTKVAATLSADNLLVTGVGLRGTNYTTYVTDGTTYAILYGPNKPIAKKGDKLAGKLTGNVVIYNSALELDAVDYEKAAVASSDNEVKPETLTIATINNDTKATYQSRYVRLENVAFEADTLANSNISLIDDSDNTITLRDNFNVLGDFVFDTNKNYNINAYVAYFRGNAQLYVCSADDIEILTNLKDAETAWAHDTIVVIPNHELEANELSTLSDGKKTYSSSNEKVATIDAEGNITRVGYGHTVITVETPETANYLASKASFDLYYIEGEGTFEKPYSAADLDYFNGRVSEKVWVKGTIIGYISDTQKGTYSPADKDVVATNLAVGTPDAYIPVQLPKGKVRDAINLKDNADKQGTTVWLYGNIATYCGKAGLKNVTNYSLDGVTGIGQATNDANAPRVIYSIDGRRLSQPVKGINIINGRKVLVK